MCSGTNSQKALRKAYFSQVFCKTISACPWGNRYMDCTGANCDDPKIRDYCCETCTDDLRRTTPGITTTLSPLSPGSKRITMVAIPDNVRS